MEKQNDNQLHKETKISGWFIPIALIWIFAFAVTGMISEKSGPPTLDKFLRPETIIVLGAPVVITLIFYWLFKRFQRRVGFIFTFVAGGLMSIETIILYLNGKIDSIVGPVIFTILIWPILLIPPYFLTKLADKSKTWKIVIMILLILFLTIEVIRII